MGLAGAARRSGVRSASMSSVSPEMTRVIDVGR
jgi:hypothetical protein